MRKRRLDLGILQRDVARQLEVNKDTVRNWELNRTKPAPPYLSRIVDFLGQASQGAVPQGQVPAPGKRGRPELLDP